MSFSPIHVLGVGNLGKLVAHSLRKCYPDVPITFLFHRSSLVEEWDKAGRSIEITRNGELDRQRNFDYEIMSQQQQSRIENLIVATKTYTTVHALRPLQDRFAPSSTLLFLQNGIGTIDEVTNHIFPQPASRPNYLAGIVNHGVYATSKFSSVHAGLANAILGPVQVTPSSTHSSDPFLAEKIVGCSVLSASVVSAEELLYIQLEKLAINAVINPLTVIFDCLNGELFKRSELRPIIHQVIAEVSAVFQAIISSQTGSIEPIILDRFSPGRLQEIVYQVGDKTARNISSMRQDARAGRRTEIDYINGYIINQGNALGIQCPFNAKIVGLVRDPGSLGLGCGWPNGRP